MSEIKVGDIVKFTEFSYINTATGTGTADACPHTDLDIRFMGIAQGKVISRFHDYECGWRFHVTLDEEYWELIKDIAVDQQNDRRVFVSEFDIVK